MASRKSYFAIDGPFRNIAHSGWVEFDFILIQITQVVYRLFLVANVDWTYCIWAVLRVGV